MTNQPLRGLTLHAVIYSSALAVISLTNSFWRIIRETRTMRICASLWRIHSLRSSDFLICRLWSCRIISAGRLADVNSRTGKFITRFQAKPRAVAPSFYIKMFANTSFFLCRRNLLQKLLWKEFRSIQLQSPAEQNQSIEFILSVCLHIFNGYLGHVVIMAIVWWCSMTLFKFFGINVVRIGVIRFVQINHDIKKALWSTVRFIPCAI